MHGLRGVPAQGPTEEEVRAIVRSEAGEGAAVAATDAEGGRAKRLKIDAAADEPRDVRARAEVVAWFRARFTLDAAAERRAAAPQQHVRVAALWCGEPVAPDAATQLAAAAAAIASSRANRAERKEAARLRECGSAAAIAVHDRAWVPRAIARASVAVASGGDRADDASPCMAHASHPSITDGGAHSAAD